MEQTSSEDDELNTMKKQIQKDIKIEQNKTK